jgi:hypothetical protein
MLNPRIMIASTASFIMILAAMNYVTNRNYHKMMPKLEEEKEARQQELFARYIQKDLENLGDSPGEYGETLIPPVGDEYPETETYSRQSRPLGTWMGVRKGDETNIAVMRFDRMQYWLMIKDPVDGEITEKGKYDFQFGSIRLKPQDGEPYLLDYYIISRKGMQLYGYDYSFNFEKAENIELEF